eukprot:4607338-Prymnesium_polylepis.1
MARVQDARTTQAGSHAEVAHQTGAGTARGAVMQGSGMGLGGGAGDGVLFEVTARDLRALALPGAQSRLS